MIRVISSYSIGILINNLQDFYVFFENILSLSFHNSKMQKAQRLNQEITGYQNK